ncbi:HAD family hydrolase [Limisalsivibrio acetivorans]|uniref:HAD family hydrolase n=1 Tax=Limisalsivibrio acetivorans TaxID=1304888 RepID=UPI000416BA47|nr:HAD family phosphatase [Limisalsivibrio acetivorans]
MITTVIFDFGGVIAEEGWAKGVRVIAEKCGHEPEGFFKLCVDTLFETGFVTGAVREEEYWEAVSKKTDLCMSVAEMKNEILGRFVVRPEVIELVKDIRKHYTTVILSDQTHWLDELNERDGFFENFDHVFNSYHDRKSKRDESYFTDTCRKLNIRPDEAVFIDDNPGNIERCVKMGLYGILCTNFADVKEKLGTMIRI